MAITHIVLFKANPSKSQAEIKELYDSLHSLKTSCLHPTTKETYIKSITGGKNNSPEGRNGNFDHAYTIEFESAQHRDYYAEKDPAHKDFVKLATSGYVSDILGIDYEDGVL